MHALTGLALVLGPAAALAGSAHPQLFVSPAPHRLAAPLELDAREANAVLAHHLGVQHLAHLPTSTSTRWHAALDDPLDHRPAQLVIVLECHKSGCNDAIPTEILQHSPPIALAALPANSYLAAVTLHLHRLADQLGLDRVQGLQDLVDNGIKTAQGWQAAIGQDLARWIGYADPRNKANAAVKPHSKASGLIDDLDLLDPSSAQLVLELEKLAALVDDVSSAPVRRLDSGPQGQGDLPQLVVVHLKGLKAIAAQHALTSPTYQRAQALLRETLTGTIAALRARLSGGDSHEAKVVVLALPPHAQPLLRRREEWLKPFEAPGARYGGKAAAPLNAHKRRSVFSPRAAQAGEDDDGDKAGGRPLVPAGKTCFPSLAALENATASCLGRGEGVRGVSTRAGKNGDDCWVCRCHATEDDEGRRTRWSGEGCEKEDLSGSALLLAGTTVFLALLVAGSVALLYNIGDVPLPGTLSAVSGMSGHAKRD
ncbi:hypothetical protein JCM3770_000008 [Rhodotorula araucariae]